MPHGFTEPEHAANVAEAVKSHGAKGGDAWVEACALVASYRTDGQIHVFLNERREEPIPFDRDGNKWGNERVTLVRALISEVRAKLDASQAAKEFERVKIGAAAEAVVAFAAKEDAELQAKLAALDAGRRP
jgi:hypothetical protein